MTSIDDGGIVETMTDGHTIESARRERISLSQLRDLPISFDWLKPNKSREIRNHPSQWYHRTISVYQLPIKTSPCLVESSSRDKVDAAMTSYLLFCFLALLLWFCDVLQRCPMHSR